MHIHQRFCVTLSVVWGLLAACSDSEGGVPEEVFSHQGRGVYVLNEGNYNSGNSTLSYYDPEQKTIENGVFQRANDRKLGDTGQSMTLLDSTLFIAVENSGIVWGIDPRTSRVKGSLTTGQTEHMINPRYIHIVNATKAYITDLYAPYITIFNPTTFTYTGSIPTGQAVTYGYSSTEQMVGWKHRVFTNCWSYSNKILVIDTQRDEVTDSILLDSWQPKGMQIDARGKLWVITDGGYNTEHEGFGDNIPHLYRIDAETLVIEQDQALDADEAGVALAISNDRQTLYLINNDIYRMNVTESHLPVRPFIEAPIGNDGKRHKLYGLNVDPTNGDLYVADAVDYNQAGTMYRYKADGTLIDKFRVGINPNGCAFIP